MCPENDSRIPALHRLFDLSRNPLYDYLLDLHKNRIILVEALAPQRHIAWQTWITVALIAAWLIDRSLPALAGFIVAIVILLGPFIMLAGLHLAGWPAQMIAVRNYPSPLDSSSALELLLSTPLTETEIVVATIATHLQYAFRNITLRALLPLLGNAVIFALLIIDSGSRGTLPLDILYLSISVFMPVLCVFLFLPILTAIDSLLVPASMIQRRDASSSNDSPAKPDRMGRLPAIATFLAASPVLIEFLLTPSSPLITLRWAITVVCPIVLVGLLAACVLLIWILPTHLRRIRRG